MLACYVTVAVSATLNSGILFGKMFLTTYKGLVKYFSLQRFLFQNMEHLTRYLVTFFHKAQQRHN